MRCIAACFPGELTEQLMFAKLSLIWWLWRGIERVILSKKLQEYSTGPDCPETTGVSVLTEAC